jgi:hypothetical protein
MNEQHTSKELFYLQVRGYTGNSLLWWREGRHGYTNDIRKAHVFTKEEAFAQHRCRPDTDFPWRKDYIDSNVQLHVVEDDIGHEEEASFVPAHEPSPASKEMISEILSDAHAIHCAAEVGMPCDCRVPGAIAAMCAENERLQRELAEARADLAYVETHVSDVASLMAEVRAKQELQSKLFEALRVK